MKKIFSNAYLVNLFNKIMTLIFGFASSVFITRYMGAHIKGEYSVILSTAGILNIFLNLGIYHAYPNQVRNGEKNIKQKFIDVFFLQFLFYIFVFLLISLVLNSKTLLLIGILTPVMTLSSQVMMIAMIDLPIFRSVALIGVAFFNLIASLILYLFLDRSIIWAVFILVLKDIIFIMTMLLKMKLMPNPLKVSKSFLFQTIKFGFFPMMTSLLLNLNYKMDIFMVRFFDTNSTVGVYATAVAVADYLWLIPDSFKEVLFSKSVKKNATKDFNFSIKISIFLTTCASLLLVVLGRKLIPFLYGEEFAGVYPVMNILLVGIPFMSIFKLLSPLYVAENDTKSYFFNLVFGIMTNIILNALLIPLIGIKGAAIATVIAQMVSGIYALKKYVKKHEQKLGDVFVLSIEEINIFKKMLKNYDKD